MPSIVTHHLFAKDIKDSLNLNVNSIYYTFAQSHDYLYFNVNKNNRILAHKAHVSNTQKYLISIIEYIKNNKLREDINLMSYLYGSITHYVLDSTTHPYIFYKSGLSSSKHRIVEKNIDKLLYERKTNKKYNELNISKEIIVNNLFTKELKDCIDYAYNNAYIVKNVSRKYTNSIKEARLLFRFTSYDKKGTKIKLYSFVDKLFKTNTFCLSTSIKCNINFLNENHLEWHHPAIEDKICNYSFNELYNQSLYKTGIIIKYVNKYLNDEIEIDLEVLKKYIPDISYTTGLLISQNKKMKYFEINH